VPFLSIRSSDIQKDGLGEDRATARKKPRGEKVRQTSIMRRGPLTGALLLFLSLTPSLAAQQVRPTLGFESASHATLAPANAAGAVSRLYVAGVSNAGLVVHDRTGNVLSRKTWPELFGTDQYDTRIVYDERFDRWVILALVAGDSIFFSFAISTTNDPRGGWKTFAFDIVDAQFTRLALTRDFIVMATNVNHGTQTRLLLLDRNAATYANDRHTLRGHTIDIPDMAPVATDDTTAALYLMVTRNSRTDLYELSGSFLENIGGLDSPLQLGVDLTDSAPQPGGPFLDAGRSGIANAIYRNGYVYAVHSGWDVEESRSSIAFWAFDPARRLAHQEVISSPDGDWLAYPSVAVNSAGIAAVVFSVFSENRYVTSGYSYALPLQPMTPPALLKEGEGPHPLTAWGKYNTIVVDPLNDTDFWGVTSHAETGGRWGTWWSRLEVEAPPKRRAVRH